MPPPNNDLFPRRRQTPAPTQAAALKEMLSRSPEGGNPSVQAALQRLVDSYAHLYESNRLISIDKTLVEGARVVKAANLARRTVQTAAQALRDMRAKLGEPRAQLLKQQNKPFDYATANFGEVMLGNQIRQHLASLSPGERQALLNHAIAGGDIATLKAVGSAPPFVSGLPDQSRIVVPPGERPPADPYKDARDALINLFHDAKQARDGLQALDAQAQHVDMIEGVVLQSTADLCDFASADAFIAGARDLDAVA